MISVTLIAAQTQDGFIARTDDETSLAWTSKEDKKRFVEITKRARVMVMGRKTFATIGRALKERHIMVYTRSPLPQEGPGVERTDLPPAKLLSLLEERGYGEVAICGGAEIYDLFLKSDLVDRISLTTEPVEFTSGIPLFRDPTMVSERYGLIQEVRLDHGTVFQDFVRKNP